MKSIVIVFSAIQSLYTFRILKGYNRIFVGNISSSHFILKELFVGRPSKRHGHLARCDSRNGVELLSSWLLYINQGSGGLLFPILSYENIRKMVSKFVHIGKPEDVAVQPVGTIATGKGG